MRRQILTWIVILLSQFGTNDSQFRNPRILLAAADRYAMLYNWPNAAPLYAKAESLFQLANDRKNSLYARLGYLWVTADSGISPSSIQEVGNAIDDPLVQSDQYLLLRAWVAKAVLEKNKNEAASRASWNQVLILARNLQDRGWEGRAKAETGQVLFMDGNVESATAMFRDALDYQYWHLDLPPAIYYTAMVGNGSAESGRAETALQYCNIAIRLSHVVREVGFPFLAYQGKARALIALDRGSEATRVLDEAILRARQEGNFYALAQLSVVAGIATKATEPSKAIRYLNEAVEISKDKGFDHVYSWSTIQLAAVYRNTGDFDAAESLATNAVAMVRDMEDRYHLPEDLTLLADVKFRKGNIEQSEQLYSEATDVINGLLVNLNTPLLKASLIGARSDAYLGHFRLLAANQWNAQKAFEVIEEARGREIADTLRGDSESVAAPDDRTRAAIKDINRIQLALMHQTNSELRGILLDALFGVEQGLVPVRMANSPLNSSTHRFRPASVPELQQSLYSDEIVLEYVLDEPESFCLRVTRAGIDLIHLPAGRNRIEAVVDEYLRAVRARKSETEASQQLHSILLQPVLRSGDTGRRLNIIPDGKLHLLPMDALKDEKGKYVLESHVVTYATSSTALILLRSSRKPESEGMKFLGVGGVIYGGKSAPAVQSVKHSKPGHPDFFGVDPVSLPDLPGSGQEVANVSEIVGRSSKLLVSTDATEGQFKSLPLAKFRIIHLAVHGIASPEFPDRAALVLGNSNASSEDGLLQAREIRDLELHSDLIVLSACETGSGKLLGEGGIASLERAFLIAGAKSVVASLWTADDTFTIALMKRFYTHLVAGADESAALRQAKLDLLKQFGDQAIPIYWAGFTLVGDGSIVVFKK